MSTKEKFGDKAYELYDLAAYEGKVLTEVSSESGGGDFKTQLPWPFQRDFSIGCTLTTTISTAFPTGATSFTAPMTMSRR